MTLFYSFYDYKKGEKNRTAERNCRDFLLSHALRFAGLPENVELKTGPYGKPYLPDSEYYFNISHSRGMACICIGKAENAVDCELIKPRKFDISSQICSEEEKGFLSSSADYERDFYTMWTYKECFAKLTGKGLSYPLKSVNSLASDVSCNGIPVSVHRFELENAAGSFSVCCMEYGQTSELSLVEVNLT